MKIEAPRRGAGGVDQTTDPLCANERNYCKVEQWTQVAPQAICRHSLRSGFLTSAAARGASIFKMADQSRHKSMDTLRGYVRDAEIFKDHARMGLL